MKITASNLALTSAADIYENENLTAMVTNPATGLTDTIEGTGKELKEYLNQIICRNFGYSEQETLVEAYKLLNKEDYKVEFYIIA